MLSSDIHYLSHSWIKHHIGSFQCRYRTSTSWLYELQGGCLRRGRNWTLWFTSGLLGGGRVSHLFHLLCGVLFCFLLLCCCCFVLFVFVLCLACPMLLVSLDCPLLVDTSVFANVYLKYIFILHMSLFFQIKGDEYIQNVHLHLYPFSLIDTAFSLCHLVLCHLVFVIWKRIHSMSSNA